MVNIRDQNPYEINLPFFVEEGDYTVMESVQGIAGNDQVGVFSAPVHKGDFVTFDTDDWTVKPAGKNDKIIGQVIDHPTFHKDRPSESAQSGEYNRRIATVQLWGDYVKALQLKAENSAVAVGDAVGYEGNNVFDKANSGDTIALESAKAGEAKKIAVLFGYRGL